MTAYFKVGSFREAEGKSWHGLENLERPIPAGATVLDAMQIEGIDRIEVVGVASEDRVPVGNDQYVTVKNSDKQRLYMINCPWTDNGVQSLDREITWYQPVQNRDYARILEPLTEKYGVMGVLHVGKRGEIVIVQFDMGEFEVAGNANEAHKSKLLFAENRHNGSKYFGYTNTRVVCQNTFNAAINGGVRSMPNGKDVEMTLGFEVAVEEYRINQLIQLNNLFTKKIKKEAVTELAAQLFPSPQPTKWMTRIQEVGASGFDVSAQKGAVSKAENDREAYERALVRQERHMTEFFGRYERFNDEQPYAADTAYALFQSATEHFNHSELYRGGTDQRQGNILFGQDAQTLQNAWAFVNNL